MLRRRLAPEPFAAVAGLCRASAAFGAVLAVMAVLMGRSGSVDPRGSLAVLAFGLGFALLALALVPWSAVVIWRTGYRGTARTLAGLAIALVVLAYPAYLAVLAARLPRISDVSTDPVTPPPFSTAATAVAARGGHGHDEPSAEARDSARRAYPNLQPVMLDVSEDEAYGLALKAVQGHGWRVVEAAPPRGKFGTGRIDAVAPTRVMALPDDVAIRIRPAEGQTRVDIRSASRFQGLDFGENAARIQSLSDELLDAAS
jgi:hypothetical protein